MSKKPKYLDKMQRNLVHSKFVIDTRYTQSLKPQISDWFKKMKPLPEFSRIFQEYNKRYFTLNLPELTLYYSNKERYSIKDITYIPFEEVTHISDKPHYALSNQGIEWKEAFGLTIYLSDKYIVLVAQSNEIYMLWLNYFEAIRFRKDDRSVLNRSRTPYYSNLFAVKLPEFLVKQHSQLEGPSFSNKDIDQPIFSKEELNSSRSVRNFTPPDPEQFDLPSNAEIIDQLSQENNNYEPVNQNEDLQEKHEDDGKVSQQVQEYQNENQEIVHIEVVHKEINLDFQQQEIQLQKQQVIEVENIIQIINCKENSAKSESKSYLPQPKRLDKPKQKQSSKNDVLNLKSTLKKTITNVWGTYDEEGNEITKPIAVQSNFLTQPKESQNLFINIQDISQQNDGQIDQPELLVRFDELDSSRIMEHY